MQNYLDNINLEKIKQFFIQNKLIIIIGILAGILINSVDIFNYKFGIDSEEYIKNNFADFNKQQRYGSYILMLIFPFLKYHTISHIIGIIALVFAGLLTISRHNISNTAKLLFVLLFISYPNFAFLQYFFFQSAFNFIAVFLAVIAYRLIESVIISAPPRLQFKNIIIIITAIFFLFISTTSYQATIAIFLTVMMINIILDYIENCNIKNVIYILTSSIILLVLSLLFYYIVIKIFAGNYNEYYASRSILDSKNIFLEFTKSIKKIGYILVGTGNYRFTVNYIATISLVIAFAYLIINKNKYNKILLVLLSLGLILSLFPFNLFIKYVPIRADLSIPFYFAFTIMLVYTLFKNKIIKSFILIIALFSIIFNTNSIVKYQTSYYMTYENDKTTAVNMINAINETAPDANYGKKYKIAFAGLIFVKDRSNIIKYNEMFGNASFFSWDRGNPARMLAFLELMGLPANFQLTNPNIYADKFKSMPHWPAKGYTQLHGDTVLVNLMW